MSPEAGPSTHAQLSPRSPSPEDGRDVSHGSPSDDADQSILPLDVPVPSCLNRNSMFFHVLTAPYRPPSEFPSWKPKAPPRDGHAARCQAMVHWAKVPGKEDDTIDRLPPSSTTGVHPVTWGDLLLYPPHGRWAWTEGLSIDDPKTLLTLQSGAQCTASIDSAFIAGRQVKYICRKWDMNREYDWQGFYSELALYKSERYLKPLQGDVVPHIIGVHAMPEAISVTMELPHPSFWIESSPSMPNVLKERVIAAFEKIHAHGVLHGDPELRHMLIGADGRVMIIDFGMSRAIREHELVGIEQVGPEEFRLEMRKVKYKLDYMGARKKEADKTAGYLKRVQRNGRLEQLWARRKAGQRTGPITEEVEEDPEEYKLDPPVSAEDLEEDWDAALDHEPVRVVVPGQSEKEVAREVEAFMEILARMRTLPRGEQAAQASSSTNPPPYPYYPSPWTSSGDRVHMWYSDEFDGGTELSKPPITTIAASSLAIQIRKENIDRCYQYGLPHEDPFGSGDGKGKGTRKRRRSLGNMLRRQEREKHGTRYVSIVEKAAMRSKYLRVKRMKNGHIATLAGAENMSGIEMGPKEMAEIDFGEGRGTLKDVPEGPRILQEEEYQMIAEGRRQAVVRCTQAPRGILKRRREDEGFGAFEKPTNSVEPLNGDDVRAMGGGHEEEKEGPARKKRRTASAVPIGRRPGEMLRPRLGRREEEDAQGGQSGGLPPFVSKVSSLIGSLLARMG